MWVLNVPDRIRWRHGYDRETSTECRFGNPMAAEGPKRGLVPAAKRALAEAQARRAEIDRKSKGRPKELLGRKGPDPARYGDWEIKGIASDF
jgi:hypothetical protein